MVIDLFGLSAAEVRERFPEVYQHIAAKVKPERDRNNRATYRDSWWIFGEPRSELRPALAQLPRYMGTVVTAKHRLFRFFDAGLIVEDAVVVIASEAAYHLGVLQSAIHVSWSLHVGATLEDRPRYRKSLTFDPFPFPDATPAQQAAIATIAEEIERTRAAALADNPGLTLTAIYNEVEALRAGGPLTPAATAARAGILAELHADLDAAVAAAYGWPWPLPAPEIIARLVRLNAERAAEEAAGNIRWLRPDYQATRNG
jgi:hypothetical protein